MALKTAVRRINIFLNGKAVAKSIKDIRSEWKKLNNQIGDLVPGTKEYIKTAKRMKELDGLMKNHRNNIRGINTATKKIGIGLKGMIGLAGAAFASQAVVEMGKELFSLGSEMEVLTKKAQTVFGDSLPQITAAAEKNAFAMGLTVSQYTDASAAIGDLLIPMGFQRDEAANISTNLVDLSGALSEWTGGQISAIEVTDILGKAVLGEREQLKSLGISISEADVKNRLAEKGVANLTGEMLQQAKAAATLELITEKSGDAQAAFAANSDTLVRKQAELSAKFETIREQMAETLIPVFHRLFAAAEPIISTFSDIVLALLKGDEAVGELEGGMKILGITLGNVGKFVKFLYEGFVAFGGFLLNNFGGTIEFIGSVMVKLQNGFVSIVNSIAEYTGLETRLQPIDIADFQKSIADAKQSLKESKLEEPIAIEAKINTTSTTSGGDKDAVLKAASAAAEKEKAQAKAAEKAEKELVKRLEKLQAIQDKFAEEATFKVLSDEDRKIAELAAKYDVQIEEAKLLEAKKVEGAQAARMALERAKDQALSELRQELFEKEQAELSSQEAERTAIELEALNKTEQQKREAQSKINEEVRNILFSERDIALQELETHFQELLLIAEEYGIDAGDIAIAHRQAQQEINTEFDNQDKEQLLEQQEGKAKILIDSTKALSQIFDIGIENENEKLDKKKKKELTDLKAKHKNEIEEAKKKGVKLNILKEKHREEEEAINEKYDNRSTLAAKALALAQIAIDTGVAISSGTAVAVKAGPFPANLAAIATTVAAVLVNVARAKKVIEQKKLGGYHKVKGMDDGITYNAKYIGSPQSGMLPSSPVVLASEAGEEYFVSNRDLQNPAVANYVRIIDNISRGRTPQFVEGGFTSTSAPSTIPAPSNAQNTGTNEALLVEVARLNDHLDRGIFSVIDDDTIIDIFKKFAELDTVARGELA